MPTIEKVESFYKALALKDHPDLKGKLKLQVKPRSKHTFEARKNGAGFKLVIGFPPGSPDWDAKFHRAIAAIYELRHGQEELVAVRKQRQPEEASDA